MLELLLRGYLVYLSFVQPVIYGAQLCHSPNPDPLQVTNVTLTLIFSWLLEVADVIFLSSFIAMRWLYICARIVLALYFAHPRFLGATQIYSKFFATFVDNYSPVIDSIVMRHVQTIGESGFMQYGAFVSMGLMRGVAAVAGIAKTLLEASSTTTVPAAPLPRRMSQAREDRIDGREATAGERLAAAPRASPLPASPARSRPMQPPSLFDEFESSPTVSPPPAPIMENTGEVYATAAHAWNAANSNGSSEPVLGPGMPNRWQQEPPTMVNRGRYRADDTNPCED